MGRSVSSTDTSQLVLSASSAAFSNGSSIRAHDSQPTQQTSNGDSTPAPLADIAAQLADRQQHFDHTGQRQTQQASRVLLLGIDPDTNGAFAVITADLNQRQAAEPSKAGTSCSVSTDTGTSSNSSCSSVGSKNAADHKDCNVNSSRSDQQQQQQLYVDLSSALISVYDMPVECIPLRKTTKTSPQRYRR